MNKLKQLKRVSALLDDSYNCDPYIMPRKRVHYQKTYENKNANIEYYTDEKGNIRRRKIKR